MSEDGSLNLRLIVFGLFLVKLNFVLHTRMRGSDQCVCGLLFFFFSFFIL